MRSARIFYSRQPEADGKTGEEVEICHVLGGEALSRLRLTLSYMSGYRVPAGSHDGIWEIRIRMDNGRDILVSNNWTGRNPTVIIMSNGREFLVSAESESRVHTIFDCRNRLSSRQ
jgi:hypothetical protein